MTGPDRGIPWDRLRLAAREAAVHAYAPYSGLHVGAAALTATGAIVSGCNVENASYGLTLCAECVLVGSHRLSAAGPMVAVSVTNLEGALLAPCGRCRQLLIEQGGPHLLVDTADGPREISDLLPAAFTDFDLPERP